MKLIDIKTTFARRIDWTDDKFIFNVKKGYFCINGVILNVGDKNCSLALASDKWEACDFNGNYSENISAD